MKKNDSNDGGQLILIAQLDEIEKICDWIRTTLQKEPIEWVPPLAEEGRIEIYFDSLDEAEKAHQNLPADWNLLSVETKKYGAQDWTTFWQHHFKTEAIGENLQIVPEWETIPETGRTTIVINPGLSFGTGGHFTTRFCLEALEESIKTIAPERMIDAGTGSGILSIAATKLGVPTIEAFDYDPTCVEQSIENAQRNNVENQIKFYQANILQPGWFSAPADLLCANILTSVLLEAAPLIVRATKKRMILSGIREVEADAVADTFVQLGCREIMRDGDGHWCGIILDCFR